MMLCGVSVVFNWLGDVLGLMSCKRSSENRQLLVSFKRRKPWLPPHAGRGPAQRHPAWRHRFTLRQTRRTVPCMFSWRWCKRASVEARSASRAG